MEEIKAWLKRKNEADEVLRLIPFRDGHVKGFMLMPAYEMSARSLGNILFDVNGYWIYDGEGLRVEEQEQIAAFIEKKFFGKFNLGS